MPAMGALKNDIPASPPLEELLRRQYKKTSWVILALLVAYVIVRGIVGAYARPFWFDELCTLAIASRANLRELWNAVASGFDSAPPLFYVIEWTALTVYDAKLARDAPADPLTNLIRKDHLAHGERTGRQSSSLSADGK